MSSNFSSQSFLHHRSTSRPIGVAHLFQGSLLSWRLMICVRFVVQYYFLMFGHLWRMATLYARFLAFLLSCCYVAYDVRSWNLGKLLCLHDALLTQLLLLMHIFKFLPWDVFWYLYFVLAQHQDDFAMDYCAAWRLQPEMDSEIVVFVDNGQSLSVPCSTSADDGELLRHLHAFYDLIRTRGGLFELIGAKSSERIDVVELQHARSVGRKVGEPLELGRHGPYNRQIYDFKYPSGLRGTKTLDRLMVEQVFYRPAGFLEPPTSISAGGTQLPMPAGSIHSQPPCASAQAVQPPIPAANTAPPTIPTDSIHSLTSFAPPEMPTRALNIVRGWDVYVVSLIILLPVIISLCLAIVWSIVASVYFKLDAQASVQTGFTIGSYVVTAGALLIALVAYLDGKISEPR